MAKKRKTIPGNVRTAILIMEKLGDSKDGKKVVKSASSLCGNLKVNSHGHFIFTDNHKESKITIIETEGEKEIIEKTELFFEKK